MADYLAHYAIQQISRLWNKIPPCVSFAVLNTWLNGWGTTRRLNIDIVECWLNCNCKLEDSLEHYATCDLHWEVLRSKTRVEPQRTFASFLLLAPLTTDELIMLACHVFAVRKAVYTRRLEGIRTSSSTSERLIWAGHKTAMAVGRGINKVYAKQWLA